MNALSLNFWANLGTLLLTMVPLWHALALVREDPAGRRIWVALTMALCFLVLQDWQQLYWLVTTGIYDLGAALLSFVIAALLALVVAGIRARLRRPPAE